MPTEPTLPKVSGITLGFFRRIVRSYFRRHFRSVMVQHSERLAEVRGPLIVFANHSSWWDPMVSVLLAETFAPEMQHYAPIDAAALARYPILKRIGLFPVEMATARGAVQFLRTSQAILAAQGAVWITPQGRFADPRGPLVFKPGLGALAVRSPEAILLPLAIEYTFWDERMPETLLRLGAPVTIAAGATADEATAQLEAALAQTMAELKAASCTRDTSAFEILLSGKRGTGGVYGLRQRLRSIFSGSAREIDHTRRGA
jgi:1-acyl-sn-glycerol-3-phosphate acyltransferase